MGNRIITDPLDMLAATVARYREWLAANPSPDDGGDLTYGEYDEGRTDWAYELADAALWVADAYGTGTPTTDQNGDTT